MEENKVKRKKFISFKECPHIDCINNVKTFYKDDSGHCQLDEVEISDYKYCMSYVKWEKSHARPIKMLGEKDLKDMSSFVDTVLSEIMR